MAGPEWGDDGFSDNGLYSDEDAKPPPTYNLQRRRNAFCVTSANEQLDDDWKPPPASYLIRRRNAVTVPPFIAGDVVPEETRVLAYLREHGLKPYFPPDRPSKEEDIVISSDEDEVYFPRHSDKSQQTSFSRKSTVKSEKEVSEDPTAKRRAIADAEWRLKRKGKQHPGFYQGPAETTMPTYASAATPTDWTGSSSTPRSNNTGISTAPTSAGPKTRSTGTRPMTKGSLQDKSMLRIM